ncbi:MAG: hypothetical protein WKG01_05460 [Kofleriaceae bacterium]
MSITTAPKLETHPPLARDSFGNLLALPERTAAWRVCRETTGRPREIRANGQTIRFPLDTTGDDLVELCGAGIYRVYALDEVGSQLQDEQVAKWDLTPGSRDHRKARPRCRCFPRRVPAVALHLPTCVSRSKR